MQPLFQSFVTGTTPGRSCGVANSTYMLSYDIGIGIGSLVHGLPCRNPSAGRGFALTAIAYIIGIVVFEAFVDDHYRKLKQ